MYRFQCGDRPLPGIRIERPVDRGGFGEVYLGVTDQGKQVALKWVWQHSPVELRGVRECLNFRHPHLVQIHDIRLGSQGELWVVMEWIDGLDLATLLRDNRQGVSPRRVAEWLGQLAGALDYLHQRGVVHRDLKPGNLLLEEGRVKLGDFGLAKQIWPTPDGPHSECVGTVHYMAPEVARGQYGPASDVYSLAALTYELLCGEVPFPGETPAEVLMKHLSATPSLERVSPHLQPLLQRALAKDPALRPATAGEFAREFRDLAASSADPGEELCHEVSASVDAPVVEFRQRVGCEQAPRVLTRPNARHRRRLWAELLRNPAIPVCLLVTAMFLIPLIWSHTGRIAPLVIWGLVATFGFWLQTVLRRMVSRTQRPGAALRLVK